MDQKYLGTHHIMWVRPTVKHLAHSGSSTKGEEMNVLHTGDIYAPRHNLSSLPKVLFIGWNLQFKSGILQRLWFFLWSVVSPSSLRSSWQEVACKVLPCVLMLPSARPCDRYFKNTQIPFLSNSADLKTEFALSKASVVEGWVRRKALC